MTFHKLERKDFANYKHELLLTISYTFVLALVYSYWTQVALKTLWISLLVGFGFVIVGTIFYYFWINLLKNKEK